MLAAALGGMALLYFNSVSQNQVSINTQQYQTNESIQAQIASIGKQVSWHTTLLLLIAGKVGIPQKEITANDEPGDQTSLKNETTTLLP